MTSPVALQERPAAVLRAIVHHHIRTAEPVGSGAVAPALKVSAATVRAEMAHLEGLGYLVQPHTSAGRIPTDLGYRFYVDRLPARILLPENQRRVISATFDEAAGDVEDVLRRTVRLLSRVTRYAALTLSPVLERRRVVRAELVELGSAVLLLVVAEGGVVDKRVLDLTEAPDQRTVGRVSRALGAALPGLSYAAAGSRAGALADDAAHEERDLLLAVARVLDLMEEDPVAGHVFIGGAANIAAEKGFERRETLRRVFEALEEQDAVLRAVRALASSAEVAVSIGRENTLAAMREASIVAAGYGHPSRGLGTIAVIGPTRMTYPAAMAVVRTVAGQLSEVVGSLAG